MFKNDGRPDCLAVRESEAQGFLDAIKWVSDRGLDNIIIKGDAKVVVDAIKSGTSDFSVFGDYVRSCIQLMASFLLIEVTFVKRIANIVAHDLTRALILFERSHCWFDPPEFVNGQSYTHYFSNNMS